MPTTIRRIIRAAAPISGAVAIAAGVSAPAQAAPGGEFVCEAMGSRQFTVTISADDTDMAMVQSASLDEDGQTGPVTSTPMRQIPSGSGIRYAGLGFIFHAKANEGFLDTDSGTVMCSDPAGEADEYAEEHSLEAAAYSWGGIVRAGPGMDYDRVASLREGDPVTLLNNAGEMMNGYDWFFIRLPDGTEAYQWGGILCSTDIAGTYVGDGCPAL